MRIRINRSIWIVGQSTCIATVAVVVVVVAERSTTVVAAAGGVKRIQGSGMLLHAFLAEMMWGRTIDRQSIMMQTISNQSINRRRFRSCSLAPALLLLQSLSPADQTLQFHRSCH